jgi:tRNA threonylcarbamoyl adenosine modification protein (Sua5/YciO/YrdC/YwlC family)
MVGSPGRKVISHLSKLAITLAAAKPRSINNKETHAALSMGMNLPDPLEAQERNNVVRSKIAAVVVPVSQSLIPSSLPPSPTLLFEEESSDNVIRLGVSSVERLAKKASEIIRAGGVIGVPTDTVYGIAADAQNKRAIERIYEIKGRDSDKPVAICVDSIDQVYLWGKIKVPRALLETLLPGAVTLVFERQAALNPDINPSTQLIGIRIPDNQFVVSLAKNHQGPVALTSANRSSLQSTLEVGEFQDLWPALDCVFDGGRLSSCEASEKAARAGSTVIDLSREGFYRIIREGSAYQRCVQVLRDQFKLQEYFSKP